MMWSMIIALGMNFGWGNHTTYSSPHFWNNYAEIYEHGDEEYIFFCNGYICDEHDDSVMPEDCTIESIEAGDCRFGLQTP